MQKELAAILSTEVVTDLQKWRAFVAVSELGSLTRAAVSLRSDQSTLSRNMAALEKSCGSRLFNRNGRGIELSDLGKRLYPRVVQILALAQEFEESIQAERQELVGRVVIGAFPSIGVPLFEKLCTNFRKNYPHISLVIQELSSAQLDERLADARIDIGIVYRYGNIVLDNEQVLGTVDDYLIGPPGDVLTSGPEVAFQQLDGLPLVLPSGANGIRGALQRQARHSRLSLDVAFEADSLSLQKHLAAHEGLHTILPLHTVWQEVQQGELQATRIESPTLPRTIVMATSKTKGPSPAVKVVTAQVVKIVEEMALIGMLR